MMFLKGLLGCQKFAHTMHKKTFYPGPPHKQMAQRFALSVGPSLLTNIKGFKPPRGQLTGKSIPPVTQACPLKRSPFKVQSSFHPHPQFQRESDVCNITNPLGVKLHLFGAFSPVSFKFSTCGRSLQAGSWTFFLLNCYCWKILICTFFVRTSSALPWGPALARPLRRCAARRGPPRRQKPPPASWGPPHPSPPPAPPWY